MAQVNAGRVRFVGRGEYDNSTQYYTFDLVNYNGNSYFAKSNTLGNLPTNTTYWQLIAEKGNTGSVGPTGETGNGISSITKTSTSGLVDTYTITFTNGQTTTYQITNGANGNVVDVQVDGTSVVDNGIANIVGISEIKQELEDMYNLLPKVQGTGETITLDGTVTGKMLVDLKGNTSQDTNTITYTCLGTESGDYYFVYNSTNYQFTMPTISANDVLAFNTDTLKLYLGSTEIATTTASTGTLITMNDTPNPDYPQDIHVVSGDNTIIVSNSDNTQSQSYPINLGNIELWEIPNTTFEDRIFNATNGDSYYDSLDSATKETLDYGKWYVNKQIGKAVLDGSETSWETFENASTGNTRLFGVNDYDNIPREAYIGLSNYFTNSSSTIWSVDYEAMTVNNTGTSQIRFRINKTIANSIEAFTTWLSTHNTEVYYVLVTPTYTEITDNTLISQLETVKRSFNGQTNISQVNNDKPFILDVTALKELTE